ncbi:MAG: 3-hydroxyacyl-CoA dehydrogenase family protein [Deltaproteobacteria bacterium]|nr:3-hydroxyacyl-CoA dehydrogenase family protein [Deltaproteobacteria bacterium]
MTAIKNVVVLGANGSMGAASGALFALAGLPVVFLARTLERAEAGRAKALQLSKGKLQASAIRVGSYADLRLCADADLVLEAVCEDPAIKRELFAVIDRVRGPSTIVASVTSGISIASLCAERSPEFQAKFLGVHLFNPPTKIVGCELIPHAHTDPGVVAIVRAFLTSLGREVVETRDTPAFAGNRLGFKVLNEVAQLAGQHGVAFMDQLVGSHTGRALPPLATIDLVGWDVHAAIVDNLFEKTHDFAHAQFALPAYMREGIAEGRLGRKAALGGFFRTDGKGPDAKQFVLSPITGDYAPLSEVAVPAPDVVVAMQRALENGSHPGAMEALCRAEGKEADLLRKIVLGYISYGLGLVGEVVERPRDIDRIMSFGFCWAPPGMLVDAIGPGRTIVMLERAKLPVPDAVLQAAVHQRPMFVEPIDTTRFFPAKRAVAA